MIENSQLVSMLGSALTASATFNVLVIIFLLGEYVALERQNRPSPEKTHFVHALILIFGILWIAVIALLILLGAVYWNLEGLFLIAVVLFIIQITTLSGGLTWISYQVLR